MIRWRKMMKAKMPAQTEYGHSFFTLSESTTAMNGDLILILAANHAEPQPSVEPRVCADTFPHFSSWNTPGSSLLLLAQSPNS